MNRRDLADQIDDIDAEISRLQTDKRELFTAFRDTFGKNECDAAKIAIRRRQKHAAGKGDALDDISALADEIFVEINAPRATHARAA